MSVRSPGAERLRELLDSDAHRDSGCTGHSQRDLTLAVVGALVCLLLLAAVLVL